MGWAEDGFLMLMIRPGGRKGERACLSDLAWVDVFRTIGYSLPALCGSGQVFATAKGEERAGRCFANINSGTSSSGGETCGQGDVGQDLGSGRIRNRG